MTRSRICLAFTLALALATCKKSGGKSTATSAEPSLPGAEAFSVELANSLDSALRSKGASYVARTKHKDKSGAPLFTNRLIKESSPYLLQHAHNPVNWYPWGDEAFEAAKRLDRPVLISIGYSTCHWCHVMEEESFEDLEIARYINANYIAIKVDREERPDVDSVYMSAVRAMGQSTGWPLNVWLTPERKPFFGGTYFPPRKGVRGARVGFDEVLERAKQQFDQNRDELVAQAEKVAAAISRANEPRAGGASLAAKEVLARAANAYVTKIDRGFGGLLGVRSKFPSAFPNRFLLRYAAGLEPGQERLEVENAVRLTLESMRKGGIYDQVGGGFHRYTVDPRWIVPHFEMMLYDNAQLIVVYLEAFQALGDAEYAGVASDVIDYLDREMRSPEGGYYSATDADSLSAAGHREEGAFFVWTPGQLDEVLGDQEAELAARVWGVTPTGNFEGKTVLRRQEMTPAPRLREIRDELLAARAKRPKPLRDDKVLAGWNGLMLSALARAAAVLPPGFVPPEPMRGAKLDHAKRARQTAEFILDKMIVDGRLRRAYKDGRAYGDAYAEDYAFVIAGLIELFEAVGESRWLAQAISLQATMNQHFSAKGGAYYKTAGDSEKLLAREVPARDGAIPSANSVAALNLMRLYELTSKPIYLERADALIAAFGDQLTRSPNSLSEMLIALDFRAGAKEIVLTGTAEAGFGELDGILRASYNPRSVVVRKRAGAPAVLGQIVPLSGSKSAIGGKPTAFVCEQTRCELPTSDPKVFIKQLRKRAD